MALLTNAIASSSARGLDLTVSNGIPGDSAKPEALDLADGRLRPFRDKMEPPRIFVGGELRLAVQDKLTLHPGQVGAFLFQHDPRFGLDQPVCIGPPHHRGLKHFGVLAKPRLDLDWRAPDAADLEHVIVAPAVNVITVVVPQEGIAGAKPAVDHGTAGALRIVSVVFRRGVTADDELPAFALPHRLAVFANDPGLIAGNDASAGAGPQVIGAVGDEVVERLGLANTVEDHGTGERLPLSQDVGGQRLATRNAQTKRGEIGF
jgi:hypothetical protein